MAKKKTSVAQKACFTRYKNDQRWKTNRITKLEKHLEKHPEDEIAMAALAATKSATAPRRTGYKSQHPNRTSGHLYRQLLRIVTQAEKASQFVRKEEAQVVVKKERKPRHKKAA